MPSLRVARTRTGRRRILSTVAPLTPSIVVSRMSRVQHRKNHRRRLLPSKRWSGLLRPWLMLKPSRQQVLKFRGFDRRRRCRRRFGRRRRFSRISHSESLGFGD